jgi:hypothetical protein
LPTDAVTTPYFLLLIYLLKGIFMQPNPYVLWSTAVLACALAGVAVAQTAPAKAPAGETSRRVQAKTKAGQMAAGVRAAEAALTPEELAEVQRVHVGKLPCELGTSVTLEADPKAPGYFNLQTGKLKYRMSPVVTTTGAIRLEDKKAGAVWLQLANKSMLMNQKLGQRLADECMSPAQAAVAEALAKAPPGQTMLDTPERSIPQSTNSTPTVFPSPIK